MMRSAKTGSFVAIASSVAAQTTVPISINDFPICALNAGLLADGATGCGTNLSCVCQSTTFFEDAAPAVKAACSPSDFQKAVQAAIQLCSEYGDTITIPNLDSSTSTSIQVTTSTTLEIPTLSTVLDGSSSTTIALTVGTTSTSTSPSASANSTNGITSASAIFPIATKTTPIPSAVTANSASAQGNRATTGPFGLGGLLVALLALVGMA